MLMETNVNYTIVGAFVIVLMTAIVLAIIWLSSGFSVKQTNMYVVYMKESVSGLSIDSPVEFNGVTVGSVKKIKINRDNPRIVTLLLNVKSDTPVTEGTRAMLSTRGATGMTYIALKDQGQNPKRLKLLPGKRYPIIETMPSYFMQLDTVLTQVTKSVREMSQTMRELLNKDNLLAIKGTLANLQNFTHMLSTNVKEFDTLLKNTAKASQQFAPFMQRSVSAISALETQTVPAANVSMQNLSVITNNLAEASATIKQNPSVLIRGKTQGPLGPGEN